MSVERIARLAAGRVAGTNRRALLARRIGSKVSHVLDTERR